MSATRMLVLFAALALFAGVPRAFAQDWPRVAAELEAMLEADQALRREWNALNMRSAEESVAPTHANEPIAAKGVNPTDAARAAISARVRALDLAHQTRLGAIIDAHGFPRRTQVGGRATLAAFTIMQDAPLAYQKRYFAAVVDAASSDEIDRSQLAALEDRINLQENKPQRYGTQLETRNGGITLRPVADAANLDARRREAGLMPICTYLAFMASRGAAGGAGSGVAETQRASSRVIYPPCRPSDAKPTAEALETPRSQARE
jgi:hypothetical protein